ncbi:MFS transporter [Candidatus Bathyarchaeota archaeon]|nr:MFS transporter [Candidatus Bathyarchaeota archaeon]
MPIIETIREEKQIFYLAVATALRGVRDNLRSVVWQPFALSLGVSIRSIGALESLMDFAKIIVQPVLGAASDVYGRKPFLVARELLIVAASLCFLFARSWLLLAAGMSLVGFSFALLPVWQSTVAESSKGAQMGMIYSILGSCYMASGLVGTLAAGWLADNVGYRTVYTLSTFFAFAGLIVTLIRIEDTKEKDGEGSFSLSEAFESLLDTFRPPKYLWGYYIAMSVDLFAFSLGWRLINGMLTEAFSFTPGMLGMMMAVNAGTMAVFQVVLGRYMDRFGYAKYLVVSQMLSCVLLATLLLNQSFPVAVAANVVMGFSAAFWGPAEQAWIATNVDPKERARGIGGYSTFRGLVALPGPFIGGILYDRYGYHMPLLINLVLAVVDVVLLAVLVKNRVRPEEEASPAS